MAGLFHNERACHAGVASHLTKEQIDAGRDPEPEAQAPARRDAETARRCGFTRNGGGFDDDRRVGQERALEFMDLPPFIEQGEMDWPGARQMNRIRSESKVLRNDVHGLGLAVATGGTGAEEQHCERDDRSGGRSLDQHHELFL